MCAVRWRWDRRLRDHVRAISSKSSWLVGTSHGEVVTDGAVRALDEAAKQPHACDRGAER